MADDRPQLDFDLDTAEGLEAYIRDLETRHPVPESLRYPETDEEYERMVAEAEAEMDAGCSYTVQEVRDHLAELAARTQPPGVRRG